MRSVHESNDRLSVHRHRFARPSFPVDTTLSLTSNCLRQSSVVLIDGSHEPIESLETSDIGNLKVRNAGALEDLDPALKLRDVVAVSAGLDHLPLEPD
ncbi:MAG: hypothetical protein WAK15_00170 [Candidatus Cybelea sp.]